MNVLLTKVTGVKSSIMFLFWFFYHCTMLCGQETNRVTFDVIEDGEQIEADLYFNNDFSFFVYNKDFDEDSKVIEEGSLTIKLLEKENPIYYYSFVNNDFSIKNFIFGKEFYIKDSIELNNDQENCKTTDWQLRGEQKDILGFSCNQAIRYFRGRKYTVFYTDEILYPLGPWKLNGLPGLILEFHNENDFSMQAKSIEMNSNKYSNNIAAEFLYEFNKNKKIDQVEFDKLMDKKIIEKIEAIRSRMPSGTGLKISNISNANKIEYFCE